MDYLAIVNSITTFAEEFANLNLYILLPVLIAVTLLSAGYFKNYHYPAKWLRAQLIKLITDVKQAREEGLSNAELKAKLDEIFHASPFTNIWAEYTGSLHIVKDENADGEIKDIYATTPSETFFAKETLIDLQINAGFYRHLPGILTGIGLIGTFMGLVWGLREFRLDAGLALESLPLLLEEVASAFVGSGYAILCAILVTYKEKDILNKCYILVEELNKELDSTYSMGAGEEYLARLVSLSENRTDSLTDFRRELLADLSEMMKENTERQMASNELHSELMVEQIAGAIKDAVAEPMGQLTEALKEVRGDQREAVGKVMEALVEGFMDKLGDTVGRQMQEMNASIKISSEALDKVQHAMMDSIEGISSAGTNAASEMAEKIEITFDRINSDQQQMNARMLEQQRQTSEAMDESMQSVLSSIQDAVVSFAIDRKQHMTQYKESYEHLLKSVQDTVDILSKERAEQIKQDNERNDNMLASVEMLYSDVSGSIDKVATDIKDITLKTSENFETIQNITTKALTEMKEGVSTMNEAAGKFMNSGNRVENLTNTMSLAAETMNSAADAMQTSFTEYDTMRTAIQNQVAHLQKLVETTRSEAAISQKVVKDIQVVAETLDDAGKHSTEHMHQVNSVLKQAFTDFGEEMVKQVRNISAESNSQLETSLEALSGTVDSMVASVTKLRRAA